MKNNSSIRGLIRDTSLISRKAISIFEILTFFISNFAFAFIIASYSTPIVSAQAAQPTYTCSENKQGVSCQEYPSSECANNCKTPCFPGPRSSFAECRVGCCQNSAEGTCTPNTPKAVCPSPAGIWSSNAECNIDACARGCCILGKNTAFVTEKACENLARNTAMQKDFRQNIRNEVDCVLLSEERRQGACLIPGPNNELGCKFLTQQECLQQTGNTQSFKDGFLCSAPELNTNCQKQVKKACVEGEDKVYWFDSCGNRENIFSSNTLQSWNNGRVLSPAQSCNPSQLNIGKTCGNCDHFLSSRCSETSGEAQCISTECKDEENKKRKNGESWCVYDSKLGDGEDVVGSRHWRRSCIDGEVLTEGCSDYRQQICVQSDAEVGAGKKVSSASCRINRWQECFNVNSQFQNRDMTSPGVLDEFKEDCEKISDCYIRNTLIDSGHPDDDIPPYKFTLCLPKYPPGFDTSTPEFASVADTQCSQATTTCKMTYQKSILGKWKCKANCGCMARLETEMNKVCTSLGDCGGKANILGKFEKNYRIAGWGFQDLSADEIADYREDAIPEKNKFIQAQSLNEILLAMGLPTNPNTGQADLSNSDIVDSMSMAAIGLAGTSVVAAAIAGKSLSAVFALLKGTLAGTAEIAPSFLPTTLGTSLGAYANGAAVFAIGMLSATIFIKLFGLQGDASTAVLVFGGVVGAAGGVSAGFAAVGSNAPLAISFGPAALIVVALVAVFAGILKLVGVGETKERTVSFTCNAWLPAPGGSQCSKCTDSSLIKGFKTCSPYRCQSLGQTCRLINEGTGKEECVDISPNDVSPPVISPLVSSGVQIKTIENGYEIEKCLNPFTDFTLGVKTNEPSQCLADTEHKDTFEEMEIDFDTGILGKEHTIKLSLPSLESLAHETETGISEIQRQVQDLRFFVRCKDPNNNVNTNEYSIKACINPEPDRTAPLIKSFSPAVGKLAFNSEQMNIQMHTNEPSDCRWSLTDKSFGEMENSMQCHQSLADQTIFGFRCEGVLTGLRDKNAVYFRCLDMPWETDATKRNANTQSQKYDLTRTQSILNITSLTPADGSKIVNGIEPITVTISAATTGGIDNGNALCEYKLNNLLFASFFTTAGTTHTQGSLSLFRGTHNVAVKCTDTAGNTAERSTQFTIELDTTPPKLTRIYQSGSALYISTDENSECAFSTSVCNFNFANGTKMSGLSIEHTTSADSEFTYYIKCRDIWNNEPSSCIAKAKVY